MHTAYRVYRHFLPHHFEEEFESTLEFILNMNRTFDCLNSSILRKPVSNKLRYTIMENSKHISFLKEISKKLKNARFDGHTSAHLKGFVLTTNAIIQLSKDLRQSYNISALFTRRLHQDPFENLIAIYAPSINLSPRKIIKTIELRRRR